MKCDFCNKELEKNDKVQVAALADDGESSTLNLCKSCYRIEIARKVSVIEKVVTKIGSGSHVILPAGWIGQKVKVVRIEQS